MNEDNKLALIVAITLAFSCFLLFKGCCYEDDVRERIRAHELDDATFKRQDLINAGYELRLVPGKVEPEWVLKDQVK